MNKYFHVMPNLKEISKIQIEKLNIPIEATLDIPSSKSLTVRALLLAAFAKGKSIIRNVLDSDDTNNCLNAIRGLNIKVEQNGRDFTIYGCNGIIDIKQDTEVFVGSSGITSRFLLALLSISKFPHTITINGTPQLCKRPIKPLGDTLLKMGINLKYNANEGFLPLSISNKSNNTNYENNFINLLNSVMDKKNTPAKLYIYNLTKTGDTTIIASKKVKVKKNILSIETIKYIHSNKDKYLPHAKIANNYKVDFFSKSDIKHFVCGKDYKNRGKIALLIRQYIIENLQDLFCNHVVDMIGENNNDENGIVKKWTYFKIKNIFIGNEIYNIIFDTYQLKNGDENMRYLYDFKTFKQEIQDSLDIIEVSGKDSSQYVSSVLMLAPLLKKEVKIKPLDIDGDNHPYIQMALQTMKYFGINWEENDGIYTFKPQSYKGQDFTIETDCNTANYFFALACATNSKIEINNINRETLQPGILFLPILEKLGCKVEYKDTSIAVQGIPQLKGEFELDMFKTAEMAITLSVLAIFADAPIKIYGVEHIRKHETDRVHAIYNELTKLGVKCEEFNDGIKIYPKQNTNNCEIDTYEDHRIAMSFAILGCKNGITLNDPSCVSKTCPIFFEILERLGVKLKYINK